MNLITTFRKAFSEFIYAFPIHRVIFTIKYRQSMLVFWIFLWAAIAGFIGKTYGVSYVMLGPEYLNRESFWSFFTVGLALAGFIATFHITGYILDAYRYNFLGTVAKPFLFFCVNNSLIPTLFVLSYIYFIIDHQLNYEQVGWGVASLKVSGLLVGMTLMFAVIALYFDLTNRRVLRKLADRLDKQLKKGRLQRVNVMERLHKAQKEKIILASYIDPFKGIKRIDHDYAYDKKLIVKVFDQTQLNAFIIQIISILSLFLLGIYRDVAWLQVPAAASLFLLLSILLMLFGAVAYWFKEWSLTVGSILTVAALIIFPINNEQQPYHQAFGLDYSTKADYSLDNIKALSNGANFRKDKLQTEQILERWKTRVSKLNPKESKPKMVFVCSSGGGMLASMWTLRSLQYLDSATKGGLMAHTALMTGSSGGAIGEAFYREIYLRFLKGEITDPYSAEYVRKLTLDKLNPTLFSFVVADFMFRFQQFEMEGRTYYRDRGYSLERQFLVDTDSILDKPIIAYQTPEYEAQIPLLFIAPTVVNDGRKLYISPQNISYMNIGQPISNENREIKVKGIEFRRMFEKQLADSLRVMTALRMNATFPYITPNVILPSKPAISIMDAGLSDNFGISDAVHFMYVFKDWINENTSGAVLLSLRVIPREEGRKNKTKAGALNQLFAPISGALGNMFDLQDMANESDLEYIEAMLDVPLHQVNFEYINASNKDKIEEASLSWRLTRREKKGILEAVESTYNRRALERLEYLLLGE